MMWSEIYKMATFMTIKTLIFEPDIRKLKEARNDYHLLISNAKKRRKICLWTNIRSKPSTLALLLATVETNCRLAFLAK